MEESPRKWPDVLLVPSTVTADQLAEFVKTGTMPPGATTMDYEEFTAIGRVADCDCGLITCVCEEARSHKKECRYRLAMTCAIPISCDAHGYDVCPTCDPCTCERPSPAKRGEEATL
jgi:hypothetical protein